MRNKETATVKEKMKAASERSCGSASFVGKVVNLQRDFDMTFGTGAHAQRYDPVDYLAIGEDKRC